MKNENQKPDEQIDEQIDEQTDEQTDTNKFLDLEKEFVESNKASNGLPKDFLVICRKNIGKQIAAETIAKRLKKSIPTKSNIHSFAWALNNSLSDTEVFSFGYSTKGGLWVTIKQAK